MSIIGSNSPELLIELDRSRPRSLRAQIEESLRTSIRGGRLPAGMRLPSSRALAADLEVTRGVVVSAYEQLVAEGYLSSLTGAGTIVNETADAPSSRKPATSAPPVEHDLRPCHPDLDLFPRAAWNRAARAAMNGMGRDELGYNDVCGLPRLREALADYLARVRGVSTTADNVMICSGFGHGYGLVLEALRDLGVMGVATEDPGYDETRLIAERFGHTVHPVAVDGEGLDAEALAVSPARIVAITPAHQAPTGVVLSPERRAAIVGWAHDVDGYIVEDDYDAEFRYDRQPIGALQGVAADRTVYIGTLSKCLSPGLRLGWLVLPTDLVEPVSAVRALVDGFTSTVDQAIFAELLDRGDLDRHLRRARRIYRHRRDALVEALFDAIPDAHADPGSVAAGLHVPLTIGHGIDDEAVVQEARRLGVLVASMRSYRATPAPAEPGLVVGFGRVRPEDAPRAAQRLAEAIDRCRP